MAHCGLGSIPGCHMWVEFVVGSRPCSKDSSFTESSGFPPSARKNKPTNKQKTKKTIQIRPGSRGQEEPPRGMAAAKFSFPFPLFPLF